MLRTFSSGALLSFLPCLLSAQGDLWLARLKNQEFQAVKDRTGLIVVEMPRKDWRNEPGKDPVLLSLSQRRKEATVVVEQQALQQPLQAEDITELFGQLEIDRLKGLNPEGEGFSAKVFALDGHRVVVVQFTRKGPEGLERVRQYSYPEGIRLFRLTCVATTARFAKYEPLFAHMAASLRRADGT